MNPAVRDLWVAALISGTYRQNRGRLLNPDGSMCCLGVLCDLYRIHVGAGAWGQTPSLKDGIAFTLDARESYVFPPPAVLDWAGLCTDVPKGTVPAHVVLAGKNDGARWSFDAIAAYIVREL